MNTVEGLYDSVTALLPTGHAWPRDPDSVLMRVLRGIAQSHADLIAFTQATVKQWQPHTTTLRMGEWEKACGLPDLCFGAVQGDSLRRAMLLRTLRGLDLPLFDSSPAAPAVIEQACAEIGYEVEVFYNTPFRAGHRLGRRLGVRNGVLNVVASVGSEPLRVGGRVGSRLVHRINAGPELDCYLRRIVPSRFSINVIFE